jgi:integrase
MPLAFSAQRQGSHEPEQLQLYSPAEGGLDMAALKRKVVEMRARRAPETQRAYAQDWRDFERWCKCAGRQALPASAETVSLYTVHAVSELGRSVSTQSRRLAAIAGAHRAVGAPNPVTLDVRAVLAGLRRAGAPPPEGKAALTVDQLRACVAAMPKTDMGARDRAVMLLGFASGMRRSELSALDLADCQIGERGVRLVVRRSKTDQEGDGRELGVFRGKRKATDPVGALQAWLRVRGKQAGPLFYSFDGHGGCNATRMLPMAIYECVRRSVARIGLDPDRYGGHSLRAGMVTAAAEAGVPESMIMQRSGHKTIAMVARYVRPARLWSYDVLAKAL